MRVVWLMALVLLISCVAVAQSANPAATLSGVITDPVGAVVVGAVVTILNNWLYLRHAHH